MKNKFFACFKLIPISISLFIVSVSIFFIIIGVDGLPEPTYLLIISIILLLALPTVLMTLCVFVGCIMIEVNKEGIATVLFGKKIKFFRWEEITKVETYIENRDANQYVLFCRNKEKIQFSFYCLDLSKMALLQRYAPEHIIKQLNSNVNQ